MEVKWHEWCRLCARGDSNRQNINLTLDSNLTGISTAIGKYFWVNIRPTDPNQFVCQDCYKLINMLVSFTERINKVQAMFLMLQSTKSGMLDPYEVRSQFDLLDEDWEHIIKSDRKSNDDYGQEDDEMDSSHSEMNLMDSQNNENETAATAQLECDSDSDDNKNLQNIVQKEMKDEIKEISTVESHDEESEDDENGKILLEENELAFSENNDKSDVLVRQKPNDSHSNEKEIYIEREVQKDTELLKTAKYQCSICGKKYKNAMSYRKHMESHNVVSDLPDFICDECGKVLQTERQLMQHKRTHLPLEEKLTVECPHCNKKYINEAVMKQHMLSMHLEQSFVCEVCGLTLKRLASLKEHKLTHSNILAFKCESCDKAFKNKARLKAHMDAVHSTTTYPCSECNLQLNSKRTLKMHMLVHTNEKAYKCNFCGAEFKRGKSLKNHLIIHIGLRPYKCNFCEKTFTNGSNCRAHKKKLHPLELAEEESAGLKNQSIAVPNLYELRASESIQEPRSSNRNRGGLTPKMRALLVAAEQLESSTPKSSDKRTEKHFKFVNVNTDELHEVTELDAEDDVEYFEEVIEDGTLVFEVVADDDEDA